MTTWMLEAFNTDSRYPDDVRYRDYTTSAAKAEAFERVPKIQFTDSGHGIVFRSVALPPRTRRLPVIRGLDEHLGEHLRVERPQRAPRASATTIEAKAASLLAAGRLRVRRVSPDGLIVASCRSSGGEATYDLGFDPGRREWRCTCPVPGKRGCSHLAALRLVVDEPAPSREATL